MFEVNAVFINGIFYNIRKPKPKMSDSPKAAEKALQKLSDQLTCSVCLDTYRDPKVLPCLHVFCTTCLERLVSRDGTSLTCPNCCRTTRPPQGGISKLQSAFYINHLFDVRDTLEKVKEAKVKCEKCEENEAKGYCRDCGAFVCETCITMHKKWKDLSSHKIASLDEVQAEAVNLVPIKKAAMACSKHPGKPLEIYCEMCEELICQHCTVKTHRDHEYDLVGDCFPKHRDAITASLQPVKQQLDIVNQAVGEVDARSRKLAEQTLSTKQKVQDVIDQLHDALEARKRELVAHTDQVAKQTGKALQAQQEGYELTQTQLSSCLEYVEESLRTGSEEEILSVKTQVMERVEQMVKEFDPTKFQPEPEETLQFSHQRLIEACHGFGEVFACPAAEMHYSITYYTTTEKNCRNATDSRKRQRAQGHDTDSGADFSPPDKRAHFLEKSSPYQDSSLRQKTQVNTKGKDRINNFSGIGQRVEVKYDDGVWYKGTLTDFDITTGQWKVEFDEDDDDDTTTVNFPDEDVRLL